MKKAGLSAILFIIIFVVSYLSCCYLIPGWRIKLEADSLTYFIESVKHMALLKGLISLVAGVIAGTISVLVDKIDVATRD